MAKLGISVKRLRVIHAQVIRFCDNEFEIKHKDRPRAAACRQAANVMFDAIDADQQGMPTGLEGKKRRR